jgi:hypothetical protein
MAKLWLVYQGTEPTVGGPYKEIVLSEHLKQLGPTFLCGLDSTPRFGTERHGLVRGPQHVVVEVDADEAQGNGLSPGFYRTQLTVQEALERAWE